MYDRGLGVLEQYGLTAKTVIRGRGALICETEEGLKHIREYWGSPRRMEQQRKLQLHCREAGYPLVDLVVENQEGQVVSNGEDGTPYVVRNWYMGKECDTRSKEDVWKSVAALADLHNVMEMEQEEPKIKVDLIEECTRHNKELRTISKFVKRKKKKNSFEEKLAGSIQEFLEQGEKTVEALEKSGYRQFVSEHSERICHGDCNQHNILFTKEGIAFTNFEHWNYQMQTTDLCQFLRKILEKHYWNLPLGEDMVCAYESKRKLSFAERENLKLQLAYPWKYWKLANFYANNNKVWISQKNTEKLEQTIALAKPWNYFLVHFGG